MGPVILFCAFNAKRHRPNAPAFFYFESSPMHTRVSVFGARLQRARRPVPAAQHTRLIFVSIVRSESDRQRLQHTKSHTKRIVTLDLLPPLPLPLCK